MSLSMRFVFMLLRCSTRSVQNTALLLRDYLTCAAERQDVVEMHYHNLSRNEWSLRRVDPYGIVERNGYLQLVAHCHKNQAVREFALDRIRAPRTTGETFAKPPGFDFETYLHNSVGVLRGAPTSIVVHFDASIAAYARSRRWTFPHQLEEQPDGSVLLRGTVSGEDEIRVELLSWGSPVEVLEPATLRAAMHREAVALVERYGAERHRNDDRKNDDSTTTFQK